MGSHLIYRDTHVPATQTLGSSSYPSSQSGISSQTEESGTHFGESLHRNGLKLGQGFPGKKERKKKTLEKKKNSNFEEDSLADVFTVYFQAVDAFGIANAQQLFRNGGKNSLEAQKRLLNCWVISDHSEYRPIFDRVFHY